MSTTKNQTEKHQKRSTAQRSPLRTKRQAKKKRQPAQKRDTYNDNYDTQHKPQANRIDVVKPVRL